MRFSKAYRTGQRSVRNIFDVSQRGFATKGHGKAFSSKDISDVLRTFDGQGQAYTKVLPPMGLWSSEAEETSLMFLGDVSLELSDRHSETSKMFQSKRRAAGGSLIPRGPPSSSQTALQTVLENFKNLLDDYPMPGVLPIATPRDSVVTSGRQTCARGGARTLQTPATRTGLSHWCATL